MTNRYLPKIDWANPITRNLFDCYYFDPILYGKNLAVQSVPMSSGANSNFSSSIMGASGVCNGSATFNFPDHGNLATGDCTIRVRFVLNATPGGADTTVVKKGSSSNEYALYLNTFTQISYIGFGGGFNNGNSGTINGVGLVNDIVVVRPTSTGNCPVYLNGVLLSVPGGITGNTASSGVTTFLGHDTGGNTNINANYFLFQTWQRQLSQSEVQQLYADPYLMLKQSPTVIRAISGGGAKFRRTLSGIGTRIGSRQAVMQ